MCQLQQKHFLRQDSNLTHPFHLVSGYHKSRIFVSASRIIQSLLNNSKAISVPKMNKIFFLFLSSPYISFHFIRFRLHFRFHFRFHFKLHHESFHFMFHFMFHIISHPFHFDSFHSMLTSGGISWLSPGSDYFISCQYPAASQRSVPGLTISFLRFGCHSLSVIFGV